MLDGIKIGDKIEVEVDNSFAKSYVQNETRDTIKFVGFLMANDPIWPDDLILDPIEKRGPYYFSLDFRIISKRKIVNIFKLSDDGENEKIDLEDLPENKTRKWKVSGSKGNKYDVVLAGNKFSCNCVAGLMNRHCRHVKAVEKTLGES